MNDLKRGLCDSMLILSMAVFLCHGIISAFSDDQERRKESRLLGAVWAISAGAWYCAGKEPK